MATVQEGMVAFFLADSGVAGQIGARFYPCDHAPQLAAGAFATWKVTHRERKRHLKGSSGIDWLTVEITITAVTAALLMPAVTAIDAAISEDGYAGTWAGHKVFLAAWDDDNELYVPPFNSDDAGVHQYIKELVIRAAP